ncbi:hypothetical protein BJ166DRAFT_520999 [Pestalotiopsis sp. NC0098]|nr:hypothetical protein BJ166DRAFT_520999 [Pestalotiopsis sp. NC0098]
MPRFSLSHVNACLYILTLNTFPLPYATSPYEPSNSSRHEVMSVLGLPRLFLDVTVLLRVCVPSVYRAPHSSRGSS